MRLLKAARRAVSAILNRTPKTADTGRHRRPRHHRDVPYLNDRRG